MFTVYADRNIDPEALAYLAQNARMVHDLDDIENIDAIIARGLKVTADVIGRAPKLKLVARHGVGYDTVDLEAAKAHGVTVINTPTTNAESVAEMVVRHFLNTYRHTSDADRAAKEGRLEKSAPDWLRGREIKDKVFGQIGMGNIARRIAEIMHAGFGAHVLGFDPFVSAEDAAAKGFEKVETLEELLERSDLVNINVPLLPSTRDMIAGSLFDHFKKDAVLVNAARGGVVNEDDLYEALSSGKLRAAAVDTFVEEPPRPGNKLLTLPNLYASPHIGGSTDEALYRTGFEVVEETIRILNGGEPKHRVV